KLDWREYIHSDNPVAAALLSKMGFRPEERVRVKLEFLRMLARMKLDPARMELLAAFFEAYLKLNREEEEQLYRELGKMDKKEVDAIMQITTSWHEKGRAEGRAEGLVEGRAEGRAEGLAEGRAEGLAEGKIKAKQEVICRYLARRFGADSAAIQEKVPQLTDMDALDRVLDELFAAGSLEEARNIIWEELSRFVQ
ncbi:MAG TPA: transposase, partial [Syntrophomonadaceae bacterium]|nr:transposase [Syntrophomonadaceae bacterium]